MPGMKNKAKIWGLMALTLATYVAFIGFRVWWLGKKQQDIRWIAELWAPTAALSILTVTFVEKLTLPQRKPQKARPRKGPTRQG